LAKSNKKFYNFRKMKKFSSIPVFFAISIISVFILSFPAKINAQEFIVDRWPTNTRYITSCYCWRCNPPEFHKGIDIGAYEGEKVFSVADGNAVKVVTGCAENQQDWCGGGYGNHVVIQHNIGGIEFQTLYAHLSEVLINNGDHVSTGQLIGKVGNSGYSEGPHLHFGMYKPPYDDIPQNTLDPLAHFPGIWTNNTADSDANWCTPEYYEQPDHLCPYSSVDDACKGIPHPHPVETCTTCDDAPIPQPSDACGCDEPTKTEEVVVQYPWTGNKAVGSCGAKIYETTCHTNCAKTFTCSETPSEVITIIDPVTGTTTTSTVCYNQWQPSGAYCKEKDGKTSWCDGEGTLKKKCLPWEAAVHTNKLGCDDKKCWTDPSTALFEGHCTDCFTGSPDGFQSCPLECKCWGQCMAPVTNYHYYDGEGELDWGKDCASTYSTDWERKKCEEANKEGVKLPVSFGWEMPTMTNMAGDIYDYTKYWASTTPGAPASLIFKIDDLGKELLNGITSQGCGGGTEKHYDKGIFLENDKLLNETKFNNEDEALFTYVLGVAKIKAPDLYNEYQSASSTKKNILELFKGLCLKGVTGPVFTRKFQGFLQKWNPSVSVSTWVDGIFGSERKDDLDQICRYKDRQRLDQLLYFIYFSELGDAVGKPGSIFNYSISQDKLNEFGPCTLKSDKGYEWSVRLCCGKDPTNCGPPSNVATTTGRIEPYPAGSNKQFFKTSPAPEPVGILESTIKDWDKPHQIEVDNPSGTGTISVLGSEHLTIFSYRWIDTDWNGPNFIELKEGDYVEPEWCSATTSPEASKGSWGRYYFKISPPFYKLRAFYDDQVKLFDTTKTELETAKKDIKAREEEIPPKCEAPKTSAFCAKDNLVDLLELEPKFCLCEHSDQLGPFPPGFAADPLMCREKKISSEICYPSFGRTGSPRLEWDTQKYLNKKLEETNAINISPDELQWDIHKLIEGNCLGSSAQSNYGTRLAKEEAYVIQEDPYLPLQYGNGIEYMGNGRSLYESGWTWFWNNLVAFLTPNYRYKENLGKPWKWDFQQLFFSHNRKVNWQVGTIEKSENEEPIYSQKWNFKLTTLPIREWQMGNEVNPATSSGQMVPVKPLSEVSFWPPNPEENATNSPPVANRLQVFKWEKIPRALSYRLDFKDEDGNIIPIPKEYSFIKTPEGSDSYLTTYKLNQIWPSLRKQGQTKEEYESDPNFYRLDRNFSVKITPCWDEWGKECDDNLSTTTVFKTTGAKPTGLDPGLDITLYPDLAIDPNKIPKKKIPRYLNWDAMPGAASYFYDIKGPTNLKGVVPLTSQTYANLKGDGNYTWKVKTCADTCDKYDDETLLQCGTSSDEMLFYGCELKPINEGYSPSLGQQFFPWESPINFGWAHINCIDLTKGDFYTFDIDFTPGDCKNLKKELRDQCEEIQSKEECQKPKHFSTIVGGPAIARVEDLPNTPQKFFGNDYDKWCIGTYNWSIKGCLLDSSCHMEQVPHPTCPCGGWYMKCDSGHESECGDESPFGYFNVVLEKAQPMPSGGTGFGTCKNLIPCTWGNCTLKDIPKLIENIINCILWTLFPIALFGLVIYTGIVFYFAMGAPETLEKVKSIWKAGGKGFLLMFLAWTILNLIFQVLGWRKGSFGDWFNPIH
jgi:hypothetical protein